MADSTDKFPLVSIFCMCKDCHQTIRRCVESVLSQDYPNIELVVQDGASTDGTLEILKEYGGKIKLISEPDSGPAEAFFRALKRCSGDIVGSCMSDEELLSHAASWAVNNFAKHPSVAAIYGDYYSTDIEGNIIRANKAADPFDFARYLCHEIVPPFCSSFFKRVCLEEINFKKYPWSFDCGEFEWWVRVGKRFRISYVPGLVSKFAVHSGSRTRTTSDYIKQTPGRMRVMDALFSDSETPHELRALRLKAYAGLHLWIAQTFIGLNAFPEAKKQIQKAIEYQPDSARLYSLVSQLCNYGIKLLNKGAAEESLDYFDLALNVNLPFPHLNYVRAIALAKLGRVDKAIAAAKAQLAVHPEHADTKHILKQLLQNTDHTSQSRSEHIRPLVKEDRGEVVLKRISEWIAKLATAQNRLYYCDQTPESLNDLINLVDQYKPTKIVELGTLSGLSLRTWLSADTNAEIVAIDLSFEALRQSQRILPFVLSRVKLLEQNILQVDFGRLWGPGDRVLLYVDAHDMPNVPIMDHVLQHAVPLLPEDSLVVIDDLWRSEATLNKENSLEFFKGAVLNEIDPLQCFEGHYAAYWKGGSFFGFREVVPLMKWVNKNQIDLVFKRGIKSVAFEWNKKLLSDASFDERKFEKSCGNVKYNPVEDLHNQGTVSTNNDQQAIKLCKQGVEVYKAGKMDLAIACFQRASDLSPFMTGCFYAQGVILARAGKFEDALQVLGKEDVNPSSHPNTRALMEDIHAWIKRRQSPKAVEHSPKTVEPITIFTMPKPFKDHIDVIQRNAIKSWTLLQPQPEIILLGNDEGTPEIAREFGLRHIPHVERNELGTPFLNSIFEIAQREASHSVMAYVNADIILASDFTTAIGRVIDQGFDRFLMVGQRWDMNITEPIPFQKATWEKELRQSVEQIGTLHSPTGLDYFIFKDNPWGNILPFLIGRTSWDGWLLFKALSSDVPVIDATESILSIHQDHNYNHAKGGYAGAWSGPEAEYNKKLARRYNSVRSIVDASWSLINDDLRQSAYAFPDLSDNQKTPHEFAVRLCLQGKFFLKKGKFVRAISCLEEAGRNNKSVPGLTEAMLLARKEIKALEFVKDVKEKQISVVIPTYNRVELITRAIRSVQVQTHPVAEIIIIDDASTDNTESVIKEIVADDPRVVYLRHDKTKGAQAARNTGIRRANSEWIAFLDSDDEWLPEKLEKQFAAANSNHSSIVHCECYVQRGDSTNRTLFGVPPYSGNVYGMVLKHPGPMFQGLLVRKECLEAIGLLDEDVPSYQEWDTAIRLAKHYTFEFMPEPLFVYYLHPGDTISKDNRREVDGWAYVVEKHEGEINRVAGSHVLANHYEILARKYYAVLHFAKANVYVGKLVEIRQTSKDHITEHILQKRAELLCVTGKQLIEKRDYTKAIRVLDEAMYIMPQVTGLQYARAVCLSNIGRVKEAHEAAKIQLRINPKHQESRELLDRFKSTKGNDRNPHLPKNNINLSKKTLQIDEPKVYLVSYPRSGNTLLRTYLSYIPGTEDCSVYKGDAILFDNSSYIPDWQNVKIIKDHTFRAEYKNVIYIVRDGRDAILSLAYFTFLNKQHNFTKRNQIHDFIGFLKKRYSYGFWGNHVKNALNLTQDKNIIFIKYEDLMQDPLNQLKSLMEFLGKKVDLEVLETSIKKTAQNNNYQKWPDWGFTYTPDKDSFFYGLSKNRGGANWRQIFDEKAKTAFHKYGGTEMLLRFGYETDTNWWAR